MADPTSRTALLEDPQLRPFLPLLWVAWSDGDMEEADLADLCARVEAMLRPAARIALQQWLDPASPPSPSELKALLATVERVRGDGAAQERSDDEEDRGGVHPRRDGHEDGGRR